MTGPRCVDCGQDGLTLDHASQCHACWVVGHCDHAYGTTKPGDTGPGWIAVTCRLCGATGQVGCAIPPD